MSKSKGYLELSEIMKEAKDEVDEYDKDELKEMMVETIMGIANEACSNDETDYGYMLRMAKANGLYNPTVISLIMVSVLPMSIETATMAMRGIVVKSDGSPVDLDEDQIKFVKLMEKKSNIKFN